MSSTVPEIRDERQTLERFSDQLERLAALRAADSWLLVDQLLSRNSDRVYKTHHLCSACLADLSDLRVHHVVVCPYCSSPLSFLLDGAERGHLSVVDWPYDALRQRFVGWCAVHRFDWSKATIDPETGNESVVGEKCRRLENHPGECRFDGDKERPPLNPLAGR